MIETIPFNAFMAGSSYITPLPILEGYVFFGGLSIVLLGVVVLERFGITINDAMVKVMLFATFLGMVGWFVLKNPLIRRIAIGF